MATQKTTPKPAAAAAKPATTRRRKPKVTYEQIAERAYFLHLEQGGNALDTWLHAERELTTA
jgi:hypothetical protein